jgi:hypothetical protein
MRRNEQQTATDLFNKRIGRPGPAAAYVRSAVPAPVAPAAAAAPATTAAAAAPRYVPAAAPVAAPAPAAAPASAAAVAYAAAQPSAAGRAQPATTTQEFVSRFRWALLPRDMYFPSWLPFACGRI